MPPHKKHHYVPQFYMRNFSVDLERSRISVYNLKSDRLIPSIPLRGQNYGDYLYGTDGKLEAVLADLEQLASPAISKLLTTDTLPPAGSEAFFLLLVFVVFQRNRTLTAANDRTQAAVQFCREVARNHPAFRQYADCFSGTFENAAADALGIAAGGIHYLYDMEWKLLLNNTRTPFLSSDNPVVLYNQFLESRKSFGCNIGFSARGLQVFLPLGPRHLLVLYDGNVYRIGGRRHLDACVEVVAQDAESLNSLVAANAEKLLILGPDARQIDINNSVEYWKRFHVSERSHVRTLPAATVNGRNLIHASAPELRINLDLPSIGVIPATSKRPLDDTVLQKRDPDFYTLCKEFDRQVKCGYYKSGDFLRFLMICDPDSPILARSMSRRRTRGRRRSSEA